MRPSLRPGHVASSGNYAAMPYLGRTNSEGVLMAEPTSSLVAFSDAATQLVERTASSIVAVHGGGRWPSSGIHWRSGVIVTAEEVLERDEDIKVALSGGRVVATSLAGRDSSTDVAVLRFQPDGLPAALPADAACFARVTSCWQSEITKVRQSLASASSLLRDRLGTVFAAEPSTVSSALIWRSARPRRGAPSSTCTDVPPTGREPRPAPPGPRPSLPFAA
jgi:S1-C subfamily serine protease